MEKKLLALELMLNGQKEVENTNQKEIKVEEMTLNATNAMSEVILLEIAE